MSLAEIAAAARPTAFKIYVLLGAAAIVLAALHPVRAWETAVFVAAGFLSVAPLVAIGIALAAWTMASGASDHVASIFQGRTVQTVTAATVVGAFVPVCGVTVLPLMAGLLSAGVPLAPVMAFWLASPITGPELLSVTAATLGWEFAVGKALAAIFPRSGRGCGNGAVWRPANGRVRHCVPTGWQGRFRPAVRHATATGRSNRASGANGRGANGSSARRCRSPV